MRVGVVLIILALAGSSLAVLAADNWPQFRGAEGNGVAAGKDLPLEWGPEKNIAWKTPIPGNGWSSPVIDQGKIYLTSAVPVEGSETKDQSLRVMCLDAASGEIVWNEEAFLQDGSKTPKIHGKNSYASPTPIVAGERIYVSFGHEGVAALDRAGKFLWRNRDLTYKPVHGNGGSPVLVGDKLIYSIDSGSERRVVALDSQSGKLMWSVDRPGDPVKHFSFSTPGVFEIGGKLQVVSPGSDCVCAYDPETGRELWHVRYTGYSVIPKPLYGHGLIYIGTGYDSPTVMAIKPEGEGDITDGAVSWVLKRGAPHTPSLLLIGDELYMVADKGVATCVDAKTGEQIWQERVGGNFSASPIFADGRIYLQNEDGVTTVIAPGKEYKELAKNDLGERTLASLAIYDGAIFLRGDQHLYRIQNSK